MVVFNHPTNALTIQFKSDSYEGTNSGILDSFVLVKFSLFITDAQQGGI